MGIFQSKIKVPSSKAAKNTLFKLVKYFLDFLYTSLTLFKDNVDSKRCQFLTILNDSVKKVN